MASNAEIAQALALACLSHTEFVFSLIPLKTEKGEASARGEKIAEFYAAIRKKLELEELPAVRPTVSENYR
ncbi:MAG TPA: hypothetical protein VMW64_06000 [Dehalococcoidia bacterium]|nr:hypothetical protein [Dehalococcoidia bacterium]